MFIPDFNQALDLSFYRRKPEIVAEELLGKLLVRKIDNSIIAAKIVETEAYLSKGDLSCHAAVGRTKRNAPMFENGGILYVYKIYGVHHCINFVTESEGLGSAVLIRAAEPIIGLDLMKLNRGISKLEQLCRGPGNLAKAFGFNISDNYTSLKSKNLFVQFYNNEPIRISTTQRIGVTKSSDLLLRFIITDSRYISGNQTNLQKSKIRH